MLENILKILRSTIEWQNWGWNALTASFIATVVLTVAEGWGLRKQAETIRKKKSGESLSVTLLLYSACLFLAALCYGVFIKSVAVTCNGLLGFLHGPVLLGLWKFKGFTRRERLLAVLFLAMIPAMMFLPRKGEMFVLFMLGTAAPLGKQFKELRQAKKTGVVEIRLVGALLLSTAFWTVYAFVIGNRAMQVAYATGLAFLVAIFGLWLTYWMAERRAYDK